MVLSSRQMVKKLTQMLIYTIDNVTALFLLFDTGLLSRTKFIPPVY